ncbi:Fumarylacetoacetase [uncultured Sphingopyxis sp.]|uniref:fumarylacetoacetase n=1 Tax=uncultured Sphingopyxis sp. TaxID=310581 RepID=A0A1Y5PX79_9SPHN|nr:fumarylacetoacetase [uncultured Sphingopyxis sp.]SBV31834.1 Fumarylacetoacetase [uncultured Sphingopyxis sp.]
MTWWTTDETHDPARTSWVESANGHEDFPVQNLPFGLFSPFDRGERVGVAIGDAILDLRACADAGFFNDIIASACSGSSVNALLGLPALQKRALRRRLSELLSDSDYRPGIENKLFPSSDCILHVPARIGDYTDFYVGIHHANNIGRLFRPDNPLLPNYKYVPIGYHGRASSIRASDVPVRRPRGQRKLPDQESPVYEPTARLDYELELGVWIGAGNKLGDPVEIGSAHRHFAGLSLLNDWSARDIQAWEYQPLGPFLAKNFASTISPWIVTAEALAPYRIAQPPRPAGDPAPLPYLLDEADQAHGAFAITLETWIRTAAMRAAGQPAHRLSTGPATSMYWTVHQILTHHASNGCNLKPGDLLGTGTISAPEREGFGSMLEISDGGKHPMILPSGEQRCFVEDGDEVIMKASAHAPGFAAIGLGSCQAIVLPAS